MDRLTENRYRELYDRSIKDPEGFWAEQGKEFIHWFAPWDKVLTGGFDLLDVKWFASGKLNAAYNCLDRHLHARAKQTAIIWQGDEPNQEKIITYEELYHAVCRLANVLIKLGVKRGDRICLYLPMIPEAAIAMLACARVGAIHSVVFAGFSAKALRDRILDLNCQIVITADQGIRGHKIIPLKEQVDQAIQECPFVNHVIVVQRTGEKISWNPARDHWYHDVITTVSNHSQAIIMDALDPLFILYTSGSTGKPKGIVQGTGGYLVYVATTFKYIFDYQDKEVYWCTADVGWITGHSYGIYGPLINGATIVLFEGTPNYPTPARCWEIIDKYKVNIFYTAPTAIRALRREGDEWLKTTSRDSLRILGTVGECINPEVWEWYYQKVGYSRCPVVDTWWQTETGGIMISPIPYATPLKPGSASWPFFGVSAAIYDDQGKELPANQMGKLVIREPWPGMMQTVYGDQKRFVETYFKEFPEVYLSGDSAYCDEQGYYWILGRSDDVIKVSGHRIGTQEVESALLLHESCAEAAVVPIDDEIKGQSIFAFVTLKNDFKPSEELKNALFKKVRETIGAIAVPSHIQWANGLPKTRSGKIMRRILRKIANHESSDLGDLSTLADETVVQQLIAERKNE